MTEAPAMPRVMAFWVTGTPAPQGSKRARPIYKGRGNAKVFTGKTALQESAGQAVKDWRADVRDAALMAMAGRDMFNGAVRVIIRFDLARPKGHFGTGRNAGTLRASAPAWPVVKPDVDKLIRSTLDALKSAGVYNDDSQVIRVNGTKVYAEPGEPAGARITVMSLRETADG